MYLDSIVDNILKGLNQHIGVMKCNIFDLFTSIIFIYFLIPVFGINGYIFIIFASELINSGISLYQLKKMTHFEIDYWNWIIKPFAGIFSVHFICKLFVPMTLTIFSVSMQFLVFFGLYFLFLYFSRSLQS